MKSFPAATLLALSLAAAGCSDLISSDEAASIEGGSKQFVTLDCTVSVTHERMSCSAPAASDAQRVVAGIQGVDVLLSSTNVSYDAATDTFYVDVTVQNLLNEAIGTPDGTAPDPDGIQVFFRNGPNVTDGAGEVTLANADGTETFTQADQPYFAYSEVLQKNATSAARTWKFLVPDGVNAFSFRVALEMDIQYLLVINEVLANPGGTILDANGEWFELYNAGTFAVDLQGLVIADSAASGRRPYHLISSSIIVPSGGYVVLGNTTNTTNNGGVPVDYAYGAAMQLANSLDAVKIARVVGTDTLTLDRTQYSSPTVSAMNGVSRELVNPALDNSNMDGSNWSAASYSGISPDFCHPIDDAGTRYGDGGCGTPKAQNSSYVP